MHEKPDVIVVQPGESSLTSELFHDDLHHGRKPIQQLTKRKYLLDVIFLRCLEVRFIQLGIQILSIEPFFTHSGYPCFCCNDVNGNGESHPYYSHLVILEVANENPGQSRVTLNSLHHLTKFNATHMLETCH